MTDFYSTKPKALSKIGIKIPQLILIIRISMLDKTLILNYPTILIQDRSIVHNLFFNNSHPK